MKNLFSLYALLSAFSSQALAQEELLLSLGTGYAYDESFGHGPYLETSSGLWLGHTLILLGQYRLETKFSDFDVQNSFDLALRYPLDVFRFIPWLEAAPVLTLGDSIDYGGRVGLGLDWLISRNWHLGFSVHYQKTLESSGIAGGLAFTYRFEFNNRWAP